MTEAVSYVPISRVELPNGSDASRQRKNMLRRFRRAKNDSTRGLSSVVKTLSSEPFSRVETIANSVNDSFQGYEGASRARVLTMVLQAKDSWDLDNELKRFEIDPTQVPDLLHHEGIDPLISIMLDHPDRYRMPLGLIFSYTRLPDYPESVRNNFSPRQTDKSLIVEPFEAQWFFCKRMEKIMEESKKDEVMTTLTYQQDPLLIVNFRVKMAGLCLEDFTTKEGNVLFSGNLYRPSNDDGRDALHVACDTDKASTPLQEGSWTMMRPLRNSGVQLREYIRYANALGEFHSARDVSFRGQSMKRSKYRTIRREEVNIVH